MTHILTAKDLAENANGDWIYLGPLEDALRFAAEDVDGEPTKLESGLWEFTLLQGDNWGRGDTPEMAQRYALGGYFGPADSEFRPILLATEKDNEKALNLLMDAPRIYQLLAEAEPGEGDWRYCVRKAMEALAEYIDFE